MTQPSEPTANQRVPSVAIAFRTLGRTLRHGYDNLWTLIAVGALWYLGALLIVPLGPVTAALHRVVKPMTEERAASARTFFEHLRADLRWSSLLVLTIVIGFVVTISNINFYSGFGNSPLRFLAILFGTLLIVWTGLALFAFPLALRQQEQKLRLTLRNGLLIVMSNAPGVLVSMLLLGLLALILTVIPPLFIIVPGVVALWGQENVRLLLVAGGYIAKDEFADRADRAEPMSRGRSRRR